MAELETFTLVLTSGFPHELTQLNNHQLKLVG